MSEQGFSKDKIDGYAAAFLKVAQAEDVLERVTNELFHFARAMERSDRLRETLTDRDLPPEKRQAIVEDLIGLKASPLSAALVAFVVGLDRGRYLVQMVDRFVEQAAAVSDREVAEVRSSMPLGDDQKKRLAEALGKALDKQVEVRVVVDPDVIGGLVARVGDTVIDGSVRHKLDQLRESLK